MTIEDLRKMNEEGKFPQKFTEEELQKILEVETSGACGIGCPLYSYENPQQEKELRKPTGLNSYSALVRKEAMNQDYCNIDEEGNFIFTEDMPNVYLGDFGSLTTCGDEMQVWVKVGKDQDNDDYIEDLRYLCSGCYGALSSASVGARLIKGMKVKDLNIKDIHDKTQEILNLPKIKEHCSTYFINATLKALENLKN